MDAIVNVCENWGIGNGNHLLVHLPSDLRRFRELTAGKTVILGRKTLETFPEGKPLMKRNNLILTEKQNFFAENATAVRSLNALFCILRSLPPDEICVIGGEEIYRQLLPYCRRAFVTKTALCLPADRFFPNLDALAQWEIVSESAHVREKGVTYQFVDYVNQSPRALP